MMGSNWNNKYLTLKYATFGVVDTMQEHYVLSKNYISAIKTVVAYYFVFYQNYCHRTAGAALAREPPCTTQAQTQTPTHPSHTRAVSQCYIYLQTHNMRSNVRVGCIYIYIGQIMMAWN